MPRLPRLLLAVLTVLCLLGCACGQLLTGDPLFQARYFAEDAEALIAAQCPESDPTAEALESAAHEVWGATADDLLTADDIAAIEVLLTELLADGCQPDDLDRLLAAYPMLAPGRSQP